MPDETNEMRVAVIPITDENRDAVTRLALSVYLGERCKYCLGEFVTLDDLEDAVYAGYHTHGRLAHKTCWQANNPV